MGKALEILASHTEEITAGIKEFLEEKTGNKVSNLMLIVKFEMPPGEKNSTMLARCQSREDAIKLLRSTLEQTIESANRHTPDADGGTPRKH